MLGIEDIARLAAEEAKSGGTTRKTTAGSIPSVKEDTKPSSLFIFSADNIIRRFACFMSEWPYPFLVNGYKYVSTWVYT